MKKVISLMLSIVMLMSSVFCVSFDLYAKEFDWDEFDHNSPLAIMTKLYSDEEAYNKGYEYYSAYKILSEGNYFQNWYEYNPGYYSTIIRNMNDSSYKQRMDYWRVLTLNFDELNSSNKQKGYSEAMLFNLMYNSENESFYYTPTENFTDVTKSIKSNIDKCGFSQWKKALKLNSELDKSVVLQGEVADEFVEMMVNNDFMSGLGSALGTASNAAKLLGYVETVGEYMDGLAKLNEFVGRNQAMSDIMSDMVKWTNNDAYKSTLNNFSYYLADSTEFSDAAAIFAGEKTYREAMEIAPNVVWGILTKKFLPSLQLIQQRQSVSF